MHAPRAAGRGCSSRRRRDRDVTREQAQAVPAEAGTDRRQRQDEASNAARDAGDAGRSQLVSALQGAASSFPVGVTDPSIAIQGEGRLSGRAVVDLDAVARRRAAAGWFDPTSYLTGPLAGHRERRASTRRTARASFSSSAPTVSGVSRAEGVSSGARLVLHALSDDSSERRQHRRRVRACRPTSADRRRARAGTGRSVVRRSERALPVRSMSDRIGQPSSSRCRCSF